MGKSNSYKYLWACICFLTLSQSHKIVGYLDEVLDNKYIQYTSLYKNVNWFKNSMRQE